MAERIFRAALAPVALCLALEATSCAPRYFRNDHFDLAACPSESFALPSDMRDGSHHLQRESRDPRRASGVLDTTFVGYVFSDLGEHETILPSAAVRLVRGARCGVDVLRVAITRKEDSLRDGQPAAIARLVAATAGTQAVEPGRNELIRVEDLRAWTRRTAGDAP